MSQKETNLMSIKTNIGLIFFNNEKKTFQVDIQT